ncbi:WD repeat-containing protein 35 [Borealophlyctis nickersoniae]|nr:WD repeat-containing protein 35 [Borealophlyctis nickersoniae]
MFIYLSKKIAIPNGVKLRTVAWNNDQGWIACGGEEGLLKVLKLENASGVASGGAAGGDPQAGGGGNRRPGEGLAPSNLSMNQTLEGHNGAVVVSTWNLQHRKLTTSDEHGLIIVWILYKGIWYEEMINNRNKSVVADMQWNRDGTKICIAYEDGAVIVGSVDGNRLWGKELKQTLLTHVQWSPDGKNILFGTAEGELQMFDNTGNFMTKVQTYCNDTMGTLKIAALAWYNGLNGYMEPQVPCLAVCFENGKIQIMRDDKDLSPLIIDTNMRHLKMVWNNNGSILAVSGVQYARSAQGEEKEVSVVQFYDPFGQYLRSLKVPGKRITSLSWEYSGLRIALAVDSFIYFANIRPDYKWTFFGGDVLAYSFHRPERSETILVFWNTKTGEKYTKLIHKLLWITSFGDFCLLVTKPEETPQYILTVANAIGTAVETKYIDFEPKTAVITKTHVFAASSDIVLHWQFKMTGSTKLIALDAIRRKDTRERLFHIDEVTVIGEGVGDSTALELKKRRSTTDPIASIAASDSALLIARQSGALHHFALPSVTLENKYSLSFRPQSIVLNCNSTRLAIMDMAGILKIFELEKRNVVSGFTGGMVGAGSMTKPVETGGKLLDFERKDVWDIKWADDNPELFALMEKTRMYIFRNLDPEEPITCSGYICNFNDLQIKAALLDDIMREPDSPSKDLMIHMETKTLRDTRNILSQVGLSDALQFVEDNPHPRLWKLVADAALEQLDFAVAQKALVRAVDYIGLQFLKRLQKLDDKVKQRAEIAAYFGQFEVAEKLYMDADRKDLAIDFRVRLGDWFRVVQLIKGGGGGDDVMLENAWSCIGDHYYDRQKWSQAATYYAQARNYEKLAECYYILEEYENLERVMENVSENSLLLRDIAGKFATVGLSELAVKAYVKLGDVKAAVDTCVHLNQWNTAVELAEAHNFREIEDLLAKYATYLLDEDRRLNAVELYRKANYCQKSAKLLFEMAHEAAKANKNPVRVKKLYVLAALEVERYHHVTKMARGDADQTSSALDGLLAEDTKNTMETGVLDNAWRGAEAFHFYLLAQRQFYNGDVDGAVKTATHLCEYEDMIDAKILFSLLALVSFHAKKFGICSKAFIKLESLPSSSEEETEQFEDLALSIFTKWIPSSGSKNPSRNVLKLRFDGSRHVLQWDITAEK